MSYRRFRPGFVIFSFLFFVLMVTSGHSAEMPTDIQPGTTSDPVATGEPKAQPTPEAPLSNNPEDAAKTDTQGRRR